MSDERLKADCAKRKLAREALRKQRRENMKRAARSIFYHGAGHLTAKDRRVMKKLGEEIPVHEVADKFETDNLTAALIICGVL